MEDSNFKFESTIPSAFTSIAIANNFQAKHKKNLRLSVLLSFLLGNRRSIDFVVCSGFRPKTSPLCSDS